MGDRATSPTPAVTPEGLMPGRSSLAPASWLAGDPVGGEKAGRGAAASMGAQPDPLDSSKY